MFNAMMKYLKSVDVVIGDLIITKRGFVIDNSKQDLIDVDELSKVVPSGFFVNPLVEPGLDTVMKAQKAKKPIPGTTIGVFKGNSLEEHLDILSKE